MSPSGGARRPGHPAEKREPIAVIGIGCRLPGASGWPQFWRLLREGRDAVTEIPAGRFEVEALYDPRPGAPGKMATRWAGMIADVTGFDAAFFGVSPREAVTLDPQHRLLLEVCWEAMEDAGEVPAALAGTAAGVFIGAASSDYGDLAAADPAAMDGIYTVGGSARCYASGRVSYALDLRGPSMTVDAACASSLLAVHLACESIWQGQSVMAFAGGANLVLSPWPMVAFSQAGMMAADGRCKAFAAGGDGFVRSDGVGAVVLKPLRRAQADGNPVYAVILGTAAGNDGQSGLMMAPGQQGQEGVLRAAYQQAGADPRRVAYIEAHGTGTVVGDPVEVAALAAVVGAGRDPARPCLIGSVKTNIGHAEAAAGIAGLIKAVLCLHHRQIPASLHAAELNPAIDWAAAGVVVQRELRPWPEGPRALAGVNSFGLPGTNVHVVLAAAPVSDGPPRGGGSVPAGAGSVPGGTGPAERAGLLALSARSAAALRQQACAYADFLAGSAGAGGAAGPEAAFADVCYTASERRAHHEHRLAVVAASAGEAAGLLAGWAGGAAVTGVSAGQASGGANVAFVFPGQGGQWPGMGRQLLAEEPVFAAAVAECAEAMRPFAGWSLTELLTNGDLAGIDRVQPALFAVQAGLAALWRSWGLVPGAVIGHSMGEVAAAYVAGALSLPDAARVICRRSALMRRLSGRGSMALVGLPAAAVERELAALGGLVSIAARNGPSATVVSGDAAAVAALASDLQAREVLCRPVEVDVASHSSQVDSLRQDLLRELAGLAPRSAAIPVYSTVTGSRCEGTEFGAEYWMDNLRQPVLFAGAVEQAAAAGHATFVEISPHPVLSGSVGQVCRERWPQIVVLASSRRDGERRALLEALGGLYCRGAVDLPRLQPAGARCVWLPPYPWQHERYWARFADRWKPGRGGQEGVGMLRRRADGALAHPLLGGYLRSASQPELHVFRTVPGPSVLSYLGDHRVQGSIVFPAAAYAEMALAAAEEVLGPGAAELSEVRFFRPLLLAADQSPEVRLELTAEGSDRAAFKVFSEPGDGAGAEPVLHASGMVRLAAGAADAETEPGGTAPGADLETAEVVDREVLYEGLRQAGLSYGPAFQGVAELRLGDGQVTGRIELPEQLAADAGRYRVHPAVLDACLQVLAAAASTGTAELASRGTFVPVAVERLCLAGKPEPALISRARIRPAEAGPDRVVGDVTVTGESGRLVLFVQGLQAARLPGGNRGPGDDPREWMYTLEWEPAEPAQAAEAAGQRWLVLADDRGVGSALAAALQSAGAVCVLVSHSAAGTMPPGHTSIDPAGEARWSKLLAQAGPVTGIAHLWSLDIPEFSAARPVTAQTLRDGQALGCESLMRLIQALPAANLGQAPKLVVVTAGAQPPGRPAGGLAVAQAPVWGMTRALAHEQPELGCRLVDLSPGADPAEAGVLSRELIAGAGSQIAIRGTDRYVARLTPLRGTPDVTASRGAAAPPAPEITTDARVDQPVMLVNRAPGTLESLQWTRADRRPPGPGEVEIEVSAVGVNFKDVLLALGVDLGQAPGSFEAGAECAGRVLAVGEAVAEFTPGDQVVAVGHGCYRRYVTKPSCLVAPVPAGWGLEEAATSPVAYGTAYYSLVRLARLAAGERVLVHAAAGGVGLAAVRIAQCLGAEVIATAGSPAKREFLRAAGARHVLDSRSLRFAGQIMELTGGQGVDVVLNSLAGTAMERSLDVLGSFGRFIEIGMRDLHEHNRRIGLRHFRKSQAFFAVDLGRMHDERPELLGALIRETASFVTGHGLSPLPYRVYEPGEVSAAFRHLAQARHIGKLIIGLAGRPVPAGPPPGPEAGFRADATYLITGGLGGLGLAVAQWMANRGVRHLVLAGRRQATEPAYQALTALREQGVSVAQLAADVTDGQQVRTTIEMIRRDMPPLRGVIHAAAVLDDGIMAQLTGPRLLTVLAPKVLGAWHLHTATRDLPLDFFVMFSSAAGLLGSPGQASYCAGNTFLDSLAELRRSQGLPAHSIAWGAWADIGLAAQQQNRGSRLAARGIASMKPAHALEALGLVLNQDAAQVAVVPFDYQQWCEYYPRDRDAALFARLPRTGEQTKTASASAAGQAIRSAAAGQRRPLIENYLCERGARILGFTSGPLDLDANLQRLGLDSLMAVELRNAIQADLGADIPVLSLLKGTTIGQLTGLIDEQLGAGQQAPTAARTAGPGAAGPLPAAELEHLSDQEVDDLLAHLDAATTGQEDR